MRHFNKKYVSLPFNPEVVREKDHVLFLHKGKMKLGMVVVGYGEDIEYDEGGYCVEEVETGKLRYPYTQDTILISHGIPFQEVKSQIVDCKK